MDYLRLFRIETEYNTSKSEFEYPTVSYVTDTDTAHYMEKPDYSEEYLTFEALGEGTFTLTVPAGVDSNYMTSVSYSTDDGETWTTTNVDNTAQTITTPTITKGNKVLWKGVGKQMYKDNTNASKFSATCNFNANGNIMSLLYGEDFVDKTTFPINSSGNTFCYLFSGASNKLINANNLILPATTLVAACYWNMFNNCKALTTGPELPATTLAIACYSNMFNGCSSLTTTPELPATTLANYCYQSMFNGCTALTTAPSILPATTLANCCYQGMFAGCALVTAPILPATTLVQDCYVGMFNYCSKLNYIKAMFTTAPSSSYTNSWTTGVASSGTFVKNSAAEWDVTGDNGVPTGWTVQTASA